MDGGGCGIPPPTEIFWRAPPRLRTVPPVATRPIPVALQLAFAAAMATASPGLPREVEFRDGSRLPVDLPDQVFEFSEASDDAGTERGAPRPLRLSEVDELLLCADPPFAREGQIARALQLLESDRFAERERALNTLIRLAANSRAVLEERLTNAAPDLRRRIAHVLERLPESVTARLDCAYLGSGHGLIQGELAPWRMQARYRDAELSLDRSSVRAIRAVPASGAPPAERRFEALSEAPATPPADLRRADFETRPNRLPLTPGDDLTHAYLDWGMTLTTSARGSYVGVTRYEIEGADGDQVAATMEPLFEGVVTARFSPPGDPAMAGGVHFVSCRLAVVKPGGTALVALDAFGRELGRAVVESGPSAYLAVRSSEPIASAQIVPDPEIDDNVAIDDLCFATPYPLAGVPHGRYFALVLRDGARRNCREIDVADGGETIVAAPASGASDPIRIPLGDLATLLPPRPAPDLGADEEHDHAKAWIAWEDMPGTDTVWALLQDGSRLRLERSDGGLAIGSQRASRLPLAAIWNDNEKLRLPRAALGLAAGEAAALLRADPIHFAGYAFAEDRFQGTADDGSTVNLHYGRLPTVWFSAPPNPPPPASPRATTKAGETFLLGDEGCFEVASLTGSALLLRLRDEPRIEFPLPLDALSAVRFPPRQRP